MDPGSRPPENAELGSCTQIARHEARSLSDVDVAQAVFAAVVGRMPVGRMFMS